MQNNVTNVCAIVNIFFMQFLVRNVVANNPKRINCVWIFTAGQCVDAFGFRMNTRAFERRFSVEIVNEAAFGIAGACAAHSETMATFCGAGLAFQRALVWNWLGALFKMMR